MSFFKSTRPKSLDAIFSQFFETIAELEAFESEQAARQEEISIELTQLRAEEEASKEQVAQAVKARYAIAALVGVGEVK